MPLDTFVADYSIDYDQSAVLNTLVRYSYLRKENALPLDQKGNPALAPEQLQEAIIKHAMTDPQKVFGNIDPARIDPEERQDALLKRADKDLIEIRESFVSDKGYLTLPKDIDFATVSGLPKPSWIACKMGAGHPQQMQGVVMAQIAVSLINHADLWSGRGENDKHYADASRAKAVECLEIASKMLVDKDKALSDIAILKKSQEKLLDGKALNDFPEDLLKEIEEDLVNGTVDKPEYIQIAAIDDQELKNAPPKETVVENNRAPRKNQGAAAKKKKKAKENTKKAGGKAGGKVKKSDPPKPPTAKPGPKQSPI